ncbi:MAG: M48 family metallopeptidase [Gammaproteobacteria bacterium]
MKNHKKYQNYQNYQGDSNTKTYKEFPDTIPLFGVNQILYLDYVLESSLTHKLLKSDFRLMLPQIRKLGIRYLYACLVAVLKYYGRKFLPIKLKTLAERHGFKRLGRISVRWQKTRWGSCSEAANISLNAKLLLLPEYLLDYVLIHELIHTENMSHNQNFKAKMASLVPNYKAYDRELKQIGNYLPIN